MRRGADSSGKYDLKNYVTLATKFKTRALCTSHFYPAGNRNGKTVAWKSKDAKFYVVNFHIKERLFSLVLPAKIFWVKRI